MSNLSDLVRWLEKAQKAAQEAPRALDAVVPNLAAKAAPRGVSVLSSRTAQGARVELKKPATKRANPAADEYLARMVAERLEKAATEAVEKAVKDGLS